MSNERVINLRGVEDELVQQIKQAALDDRTSLKAWIVEAVAEKLVIRGYRRAIQPGAVEVELPGVQS